MKLIEINLDGAKECGWTKYIVLKYINDCLELADKTELHEVDGKCWVEKSFNDVTKEYPMFTRGLVAGALSSLVSQGYLEKITTKLSNGGLNDSWYCVTEKGFDILNK